MSLTAAPCALPCPGAALTFPQHHRRPPGSEGAPHGDGAPMGPPPARPSPTRGGWHSWSLCWHTVGATWRGCGRVSGVEMPLSACQHMKCAGILQPCHRLWLFFLCF